MFKFGRVNLDNMHTFQMPPSYKQFGRRCAIHAGIELKLCVRVERHCATCGITKNTQILFSKVNTCRFTRVYIYQQFWHLFSTFLAQNVPSKFWLILQLIYLHKLNWTTAYLCPCHRVHVWLWSLLKNNVYSFVLFFSHNDTLYQSAYQ